MNTQDEYFWIEIMHETFDELIASRSDIKVFDLINTDRVTPQSGESGDFVLSYPVYMVADEDCGGEPMTGNLRVCFSEEGKILDNSCGDWKPATWTPDNGIEETV